MRILGIDPALSVTGYGIVDRAGTRTPRLVEAGVITTSPKEKLVTRLDKIFREVLGLIEENRPDVMVLEKLYAHYRHPTTAYLLGQARGVICLACAKGNIPLVEYAATSVKKALVGRGQGTKSQVQSMVSSLLNLSEAPRYTDVTDALALAIAHCYRLRSPL